MKKKKVLFVVHQLNFGGVQKSLISALNAIDYDENDVTLYIRKNRINLIEDVNKNISKIIVNEDRTRYYRKPFVIILMILEYIYGLLNLSKKKDNVHQMLVDYINEAQMRYEKLHYFNNEEYYDVAVSYIQGYTSKFVSDYIKADKKIVLYHSSNDERHQLHKIVFDKFNKIYGVSEEVGQVLKEAYPEYIDKIDCFENYVDPLSVRKLANVELKQRKNEDFILCTCGRLAKEKGYDLAIDAANILREKGYKFKWYFVGDGAERGHIENKIKVLNLEENIIITGMQQNPYIYMNSCDVYVQPSYEESYGLTIAEAKILCKPIVSTSTIGGNHQIVSKKTGLLVNKSSDDIACAVIKLIEDDRLKRNIEANLENISYEEASNRYKSRWKKALEV